MERDSSTTNLLILESRANWYYLNEFGYTIELLSATFTSCVKWGWLLYLSDSVVVGYISSHSIVWIGNSFSSLNSINYYK